MITTDTIALQRERPPDSRSAFSARDVPAELRCETKMHAQGVFIGPYSVDDYRFVQATANEVAERMQRAGVLLSSDLHDRLGLKGNETAYEIFFALISILNLTQRRLALCDVIHVINQLS